MSPGYVTTYSKVPDVYVPGKDLTTADTLSRAPLHRSLTKDEKRLNEDLNLYVSHIVECLPTTERRLQEIRLHQDEDEVCSKLRLFCSEGWPEKHHLNCSLQPYWQYRAEITVQQGILMKDDRVIIPSALRLDILDKIHTGHQGIQKCRERAKSGVWWPNLSKQIEDLVRKCHTCIKTKKSGQSSCRRAERSWLVGVRRRKRGLRYISIHACINNQHPIVSTTTVSSGDIHAHTRAVIPSFGSNRGHVTRK